MSKNRESAGVIIANYNNGKFFKDCLDGILCQTNKPTNCVVIDDCSTDCSIPIISRELESRASFFVDSKYSVDGISFEILKTSSNGGPSKARNIGLSKLIDKVDAIFINDIDDIYYPQKIEKTMAVFNKYSDVGLVYTDYDTESPQGTTREFKEIYSYRRLFEECIVGSNSAFLSNAIKNVGLYDEGLRVAEDYDLWLRIADICAVHHIPESLYRYRLMGGNLSLSTNKNYYAQCVNIVHQKAIERRKARNG